MTAAATDPLLSLSHYYLPVYKPRQVVLERGQGARVWDTQGREFIDLAAGIAVCGLGHNDPDLTAALIEQAGKLWHTSNVFYSEPPLRLAEELVTASRFAERVFLCNSGAEANEAAIKLVRKWASSQGRAPDQRVIVTFRGSFHGRTLATVTATAQPKYQEGFEPLPGGFRYVDFNDIDAFDAAFDAEYGEQCQKERAAGNTSCNQQQTLAWLEEKGQEVLAMQGGQGRQIDTSGTLEGVVNRTAFNQKIKIARLQPQGQELQVWIDTVPFDDLLIWLAGLADQHGVQVQVIEVARENLAPGLVKVRRLQLSRPQ